MTKKPAKTAISRGEVLKPQRFSEGLKQSNTARGSIQGESPRLAKLLFSTLNPRELEKEVIEDFEDFYVDWVIPKYGSWAPYWAWLQVPKTAVMLIRNAVMDFLERANKRAR